MRAVGYRQLWQYCAGRVSLEQAVAGAVTATTQLAKRQLTWLRRDTELQRLTPGQAGLARRLGAQVRAAAGA